MSKEINSPPISEAVSFLDRFAPEILEDLKTELPADIQPLLILGGLAGPISVTLKSRAKVQNAALKQITKQINKAIKTAETRLKTAKRVRLVGDIAAVLGSSSVLVGSSGSAGGAMIAISGAIALVGALAGVLSDYALRLPDGGSSLFGVYIELGEARFEAENLQAEIAILLSAEESEDVEKPLSDALGAANTLCRKAQKILPAVLQNGK